jgi:hypothetical protein
MKTFFRILPWAALSALLVYLVLLPKGSENVQEERMITNHSILKEMESMVKLELVRYNFKEITELTDISETYFNLFKLGPDQKIALISEGEAVGCIDLTLLGESDISNLSDTVYLRLPNPEICYYKLDMDNTRIYSLQTNYFEDDAEFIQEAYKQAEQEIRSAALRSGILDQTRNNAELVLRPMLEQMSGKVVIIQHGLDTKLPEPVK